jgi:hypothetical protein
VTRLRRLLGVRLVGVGMSPRFKHPRSELRRPRKPPVDAMRAARTTTATHSGAPRASVNTYAATSGTSLTSRFRISQFSVRLRGGDPAAHADCCTRSRPVTQASRGPASCHLEVDPRKVSRLRGRPPRAVREVPPALVVARRKGSAAAACASGSADPATPECR